MSWIVRTNDFRQSNIQGAATKCTKKSLIGLALKKLCIYWTIAVFTVFIPVLHFILVPLFLFLGFYIFNKHLKTTDVIAIAEFRCPTCEKTNTINQFYFTEDFRLNCRQCAVQLVVLKN